MALRQLHTAETMFIDDGITDGSKFPPSADAVHDAMSAASVSDEHIAEVASATITDAHIASVAEANVYDMILMAANDKVYEVTIDADGALAVAEHTESEGD